MEILWSLRYCYPEKKFSIETGDKASPARRILLSPDGVFPPPLLLSAHLSEQRSGEWGWKTHIWDLSRFDEIFFVFFSLDRLEIE